MEIEFKKKAENWIQWFIKFEIAVILVKITLVFLVLYVLPIPLRQNKVLFLGILAVGTILVFMYEKIKSGRFFPKI